MGVLPVLCLSSYIFLVSRFTFRYNRMAVGLLLVVTEVSSLLEEIPPRLNLAPFTVLAKWICFDVFQVLEP